ncbi:hypothetical protein HPP92_001577 [Vanilla planifolia]|uniref:DUF7648 domain-containing protein n=1 Tax=Vanilla planifolia TaxID=51239 RepID=A0A835VHP0_VANPL|nr:hypothetical protein HPP92_001577 [Vanilla planifolia]
MGISKLLNLMPWASRVSHKRKDALKPRSKNQDEGMENGNKPKQMLVFKTSRRGLSDEASRSKPLVEPVKEEKVDHLDDRVSCKLNTVVPFRDIGNNTAKSFTKSEDAAKAMRYFKEPKDENLVDGGHNGDLTTLVLDSEKKIPSSINCNGNQPVPDIPSTASGSFSPEKVEITMKRGGDGDQILQNSNFPSYPAADERLSSVKAQVVQKDSEVNQSYEECSNTAESEPMVHDNPVGSDPLIEMKGRSDLKDVPKACYAIKLSGAKPNQSVPTIQKAETSVTTTSTTAEVTNLPHSTSNQPKPTPVSSHKSDKVIHPSAPSGSKFSGHSVVSQASPSTNNAAMLSDEELALLLHQELNSSPRVPRVSRMRQAASLQLVSPIATSMLSKRSCVGGRDQVSVFKRKHKEDSIKDGPHKLRDAVVESRRLGQHSPEPKQHESAFLNEGLAKKGKRSRSPDTINPSKAGAVDTSNEGSNSLAPDENGAKHLSETHRLTLLSDSLVTFPGLIDDIMSKGKCSTYEELCDAVRPYWHSLRKPNGERYAYSSHSQAVLDCLRNRSEWAHLIDRGPKTNASKRRRKVDPESSAMESDPEDAKNKGPKEMGDKNSGNSCRDDFPKESEMFRAQIAGGERKGMKGKNRRRSAFFDDSCPAFSHSSDEETECHANDEAGEMDTSSGDSD